MLAQYMRWRRRGADAGLRARPELAAGRLRGPDRLRGPHGHRVRRKAPPHPRLSGRRRVRVGRADRQARLQRVALSADPGRDRGDHEGAQRAQPLPRPDQRRAAPQALRAHRRPDAADRDRQRLLRHPARRRRRAAGARRRARLRVAVVQRLPAPLGRLRGARDRGPAGRQALPPARQDGRGDHRRHAARDRLQPEQPDLDRAADRRDRRLRQERAAARRGDPRRGLHRVQRAAGPGRVRRSCSSGTRTSSCCAPSARSTGSAGCASATRCAARRASAPRSTRSASRSSATRRRRRRRWSRSTTPTR